MDRYIEDKFIVDAAYLFLLCSHYLDGSLTKDEEESYIYEIKDQKAALLFYFNSTMINFRQMFDEITKNLEEPMTDQQRERYCYSLITPFEDYSNALYPKRQIERWKEGIESLQGVEGGSNMISIYKRQIEDAGKRAEKYNWAAFSFECTYEGNEAERALFELARKIEEYGKVLDAAFVMHGIDLKQMQETCNVRVRQFPVIEDGVFCRAGELKEYIGSQGLAEAYLRRLPQELPVQTSNATKECVRELSKEPQQKALKLSRGRPKETLKDKMSDDADGSKLQKIRSVMVGRRGKGAALIILACIKIGWMQRPTYTQVEKEFGDIGSKAGFNKYMNGGLSLYSKEEIDGAIASLD